MMDTDYYYRVRAYNPASTSSNSNVITAKTLYTADPVAISPSAGDGTSGNPYQIATLNNLYWIAASSTRWGYHYIQTADIDAWVTKSWFSGQGWIPIGNNTTKFTGSYDGQEHIIDGLFINRPTTYGIGFFGYSSGASFGNLGITNCDFVGSQYIGGLLGTEYGYDSQITIIDNCFTSGNLKSTEEYWCHTGGLVGIGDDVQINNCYSCCNVEGGNRGSRLGGLVGSGSGSIIVNSYSVGHVIGPNWSGGLCGGTDATVSNSFWDTETSGFTRSNGGTEKTTVQMMTESTFISAGWDFTNVWKMEGGYPRFKWQNYYPGPLVFF
jgi:hypothetical protein